MMGKYLTGPAFAKLGDGTPILLGGVYDGELNLIIESLREFPLNCLGHIDPLTLTKIEAEKAESLVGEYFYLGHYFNHYGHFLLESLPMLYYLLKNPSSRGIYNFMPFGGLSYSGNGINTILFDSNLIGRVLDILSIPRNRITINLSRKIFRGDFIVCPRPIIMESRLKNKIPYRHVIDLISEETDKLDINFDHELLFLKRKSRNVDSDIVFSVESFLQDKGFRIVIPEELPFSSQVKLIKSAKVIIGFSGSQLHNSIFSRPNTTVIELGTSKQMNLNPNQNLCGEISDANTFFCSYSQEESEIIDRISSLISN